MEKKSKKEENISFEEAIKTMESIVRDLENGNVPLDDAINKFSEAMHLAEACNEKLKNAEESVNKILNKNGELEDFKISDE